MKRSCVLLGGLIALTLTGASVAQVRLESAELFASEPLPGDLFGCAVGISGDVIVVGARQDYSPPGNRAGKADAFRKQGTTWLQEALPLPSGIGPDDHFGFGVAASGNVIVVTAPEEENGSGQAVGAAYVFRWSGSAWLEEAKLLASDGFVGSAYGSAVFLSGDVCVVGATYADKAYVYRWSGSVWNEEQILVGSAGEWFGQAVSISNDTIVVGVSKRNGQAGGADVFRWSGSSWALEQTLVPTPVAAPGDEFGYNVSVWNDTVLVSAPQDESARGSAYVFRRIGSSWTQEQILFDPTWGPGSKACNGVSLWENLAICGVQNTDSNTGSATVFKRAGSRWQLDSRLLASDGVPGDDFGYAPAVFGGVVAVGVPAHDHVDAEAGAVYVFDVAAIPAVSEWGALAMTLLVLTAGTVILVRRRASSVAG